MSLPNSVRHINESRILRSLFEEAGLSRADLARRLDLTRATVGNIVSHLVETGLVLERPEDEDRANIRTGRPSRGLALNRSHAHFIGASIGASRLTVIALDLTAKRIDRITAGYDHQHMVPEAVITEMARLIGTLIDRLGDPATVKGVCVTVPGIVSKQGDLVRAPSIAWRNIPVYALLSQKLNYQGPLLIENDANAFAASELYRSSEKGRQNALCIFIDTGIGGAILHHGKLMRGHRGYAGEIGHIFIGDQGFSTFSSLSGTFESFSGDRAILERYRTKGGTGTTIRHFTQLVSAGEPAALETLDEWAYWLGRGLASLISVLDPETIAIGGAVAILYSLAEAKVHASIKQHLFEGHPLPSIHISDLEEDAPAIGGAAILHRDFLAIDETIVFGRSSTVG